MLTGTTNYIPAAQVCQGRAACISKGSAAVSAAEQRGKWRESRGVKVSPKTVSGVTLSGVAVWNTAGRGGLQSTNPGISV